MGVRIAAAGKCGHAQNDSADPARREAARNGRSAFRDAPVMDFRWPRDGFACQLTLRLIRAKNARHQKLSTEFLTGAKMPRLIIGGTFGGQPNA
jgi:hypothetical protein